VPESSPRAFSRAHGRLVVGFAPALGSAGRVGVNLTQMDNPFVRKEEPVLARLELTRTAPFDEEQPSSSPVPASLLCRSSSRLARRRQTTRLAESSHQAHLSVFARRWGMRCRRGPVPSSSADAQERPLIDPNETASQSALRDAQTAACRPEAEGTCGGQGPPSCPRASLPRGCSSSRWRRWVGDRLKCRSRSLAACRRGWVMDRSAPAIPTLRQRQDRRAGGWVVDPDGGPGGL
jgi:hypothetical protein